MREIEIQSRGLMTATDNEAAGVGWAVPCPFREGPQTVDMLLAEMGAEDSNLLNLALDLRSAMAGGRDAALALHHLYQLRAALDGRHYLAFYRVRCWVHRHIRAEVRAWRGAAWTATAVPRDCARLDALANTCLAALASGPDGWHDTARVRFRFAANRELTLSTLEAEHAQARCPVSG